LAIGQGAERVIYVLFLFIAVPIAEISIFMTLGRSIGAFPTIALIVATALAGSALAVRGWRQSWNELWQVLQRGQEPTRPLLNTLIVGGAGLLLLTPGFLTDLVGLTLLLRPPRALLVERLRRWLAQRTITYVQGATGGTGPAEGPEHVDVIDITGR
jgi:UPF0716 protein FxsA